MGNLSRADRYFATLQGTEYLDALKNKLRTYRNYIANTGLKARWALSLGAKYGTSEDGKQSWRVTPGGEFGELVQMKVNEFASLVQHQVVLAVQQRPAGIAKAINTDVKTLRDARIGTLLSEYYLTDPAHRFELDYIQALELALLTGEAFVVQDWDTSVGPEMLTDEEGNEILAGDLVQKVFPIWNSAVDIGSPSAQTNWRIFSMRENKYELAAKYPAFEEEIIQASQNSTGIPEPMFFQMGAQQTDYIETHYLVHLPTLAVKKGRITKFIGDEILLDTAYPYPARNFHRVSAGEVISSAFGHTSNYDLLGLEQFTDSLWSTSASNLSTFGVTTVVGAKGSGIFHQELAKGLRYLEVEPQFVDKIKVLELAHVPPDIFTCLKILGGMKGQISGINSILRGDPEGQLKGASGSAMALLQSQAIQFNSGVQNAFYRLLSAAGTGMIEILRQFADEPRMFRIAGKFNQQAIREFKYDSKTLDSISTIIFEPVNPILQTASGKLTIADNLLEKQMITDADDYIEVLSTGNLGIVLQDHVAKKEAVLAENEEMQDGRDVLAVITEDHQRHIDGHSVLIEMPNAKRDPQLIERVQAHIQQHLDLWRQASDTNPALLAATKQQVLPPMPPPAMPPGMMPPPPGAGAPPPPPHVPPPHGHGAMPAQISDESATQQASGTRQTKLPKPPINPATGERAPVAPGTSVQ